MSGPACQRTSRCACTAHRLTAKRQVQVRDGGGGRAELGPSRPQAVPAGRSDHRRVVGAHRRARAGAARGRPLAGLQRLHRRSSELAATPPPRHEPLAPTSRQPRSWPCGTRTSTTACLERWRPRARWPTSGCVRHVVDDRRLEPAEAEVEPVVEHRPAGRRWRSGRRGPHVSVDGRPSRVAEPEERGHLVERPHRRHRRWSGRAAGSGRGRPSRSASCGRRTRGGRRAAARASRSSRSAA